MLVMSLSPLLGAPSPAESPPDFSKDLPTFFQECSFYLEKPYFLVRQRTSRLFASPAETGLEGASNMGTVRASKINLGSKHASNNAGSMTNMKE